MISLNTCDSIDDVEVIECENEIELLLKFQEMIIREDPDILTGYNIFFFEMIRIFFSVCTLSYILFFFLFRPGQNNNISHIH